LYYALTEATKRRFIQELRAFWSFNPRYRDIVDHIQGKYSFRERPQYGIVLKSSAANQVQLSADNFVGTVISYIQLAQFEDQPMMAVEWIREDGRAIQDATAANGGVPIFPSPAGIYYIEVVQAETEPAYSAEPTLDFYVDPLIDVRDETPGKVVDDFHYQLTHDFVPGTAVVYEMPGAVQLVPDVNYTEDPAAGQIILVNPLGRGAYLSVDYRYQAPSTGPWRIEQNFANNKAIPGAVIVFGRQAAAGSKMAVVVHSRRQPTALEYGGKWEINLDFDVLARDVYAQQEITDATVQFLWGVARTRLSTQGIEITTVSMGGESEEIYDENGDDYFYNGSFSVTALTDWAIHVPLAATIRRVSAQTSDQVAAAAAMTDEELAAADPNLIQNIKVMRSLGLRPVEDPFFFPGKDYETIR